MREDLNGNDELYTDIALQMLVAYINGDANTTNSLINGYALTNDEDPTFMPGVIFASMMHMAVLLSSIAEAVDITIEEALGHYATTYNLHLREQMAKIPALHQDIAKELYEKIVRDNS